MKYLSWILTIPVAIVAVVFAVTNRDAATLNLWPLGTTIEAPLFILVLGSGLVGLILGGLITWLSAGKQRRRRREAEFRASDAEREFQFLQRKMERESGSSGQGSVASAPANDSAAGPARANTLPAGRR